ncbi:transcription factor grauzone-like [Culicoides brevitarsis]|uniref:transcription factor grauzone-like n=1 Tax=Culicoides brevitarsis TaxID=469753 RepID=UPI00307C0738
MAKNLLCRLCLKPPTEFIDIFDAETHVLVPEIEEIFEIFNIKVGYIRILTTFNPFLSLQISFDSGKSRILCSKCITKLTSFLEFHSQCLENEEIWENFKSDNGTIEYLDEISEFYGQSNGKSVRIQDFYTFECEKCDPRELFGSFREFQAHFRTIHGIERPFISCCGKKLFKKSALLEHIDFHEHPESFRCGHCSKILGDRKNLRAHVMQNHGNPDEKPFECHDCGKRFAILEKLRSHVRVHMTPETKKALKKFVCHECGQLFVSNSVLKTHLRNIHTENYFTCDDCERNFKSKFDFLIHRRNFHDEEGPPRAKCPDCGKWYSNSKTLRVHVKMIHERKNGIRCEICDKLMASKQSLSTHVRLKHKKRLFHCEYCEKSFQTATRLREHTAVHTGISLYRCRYCLEKTFNVRANMYKHLKRMHSLEWERDKVKNNQNS